MKLYELSAEYNNFMEAIEAGIVPDDAITDTLESINSELEAKADNIACMLKNLASDIAALRAEETSLNERRKEKERHYESIKSYLSSVLISCGKTKIETTRNKISFRKSKSVSISDEKAFIYWAEKYHDDLLIYKEPTVNKTAVKAAIDSGEEISGASIVENNNIQIK